jgi:hypothetical protein
MLGVTATAGRVLSSSDAAPDASPVVVISTRLARTHFGTPAAALGGGLNIGGRAFTVVGVVTDDFPGIGALFAPTRFWLPIERAGSLKPAPAASFDPARRDFRWLTVRARLREGVSLPRAAEEVSLIGRGVEAAFPSQGASSVAPGGPPAGRFWRAEAVSTRETTMFSNLGLVLMAGVGLMLLMACVNLANLGLSRSTVRSQEFAVRRTLGASRWRLIRGQLVECSLVVAFGALLAVWATRWLITVMHVEFPISRNLMLALEPEVTPAVVVAAASACLLSMLVVGLLPAWRSTSPDLRSPLGGDGATTPRNVGTHRG